MIDLLITGTGRCGTMYMSRLLTMNGVPCGHEDVYTVRGIKPDPTLVADCSWAAAPWLAGFPGRVVHLVRDPVKVVRALYGVRFFARKGVRPPGYKYVSRWVKRTGDEAWDAMRFVLTWNHMIEPHADMRIRVEDQPDADFLQSVGIDRADAEPARDTNHRPRKRRRLAALPEGPEKEALLMMRERYGYQ